MSDEQKTTEIENVTQEETAVSETAVNETVNESVNDGDSEAATAESPVVTADSPAAVTNGAGTPPAPAVSLRDLAEGDDLDGDDDFDEDDDFDGDEDEDDSNYVEGPAEYVQREKSGRARRIGSDIRVNDIDYKNIPMLSRFLDRRGRILSRRKTKVSAKVQRSIVKAIKRARHLALLPYTGDHTRIVQKRGR